MHFAIAPRRAPVSPQRARHAHGPGICARAGAGAMAALYSDANPVYARTPARPAIPPPSLQPPRHQQQQPSHQQSRPPHASSSIPSSSASRPPPAAAETHSAPPQPPRETAEPPPDDDAPPPLAPAEQPQGHQWSKFAMKVMMKSGWKPGAGAGADESGMAEPIEVVEKADRAGLGFESEAPTYEKKKHVIDIDREYPHEQKVKYIHFPQTPPPNFADHLKLGPPREADYDIFCTQELVQQMFAAKDKFSGVPEKAFVQARYNANPYETVGKSIFQNRAAVKMANLDHLFHLSTPPEGDDRMLYFADICAGPGGFTEYMMWRRKMERAKGWGFTLRGDTDFRLDKFNRSAPCDNFKPYYGVDDTGNIYRTDNIKAFGSLIDRGTDDQGVHLVTADGGFNVDGEENYQEVKVRQLVLCQFLTAMYILRKGGSFLCKIFDCFTPFTVGLLYILYTHFDDFSLVKPYSSRPANSERYVVCKGLRTRRPPVLEYLFHLNSLFNAPQPGVDVLHIVDLPMMLSDQQFYDTVRNHNLEVIKDQIEALQILLKYIEDPDLLPVNQPSIRKRCLNEWGIPDDRFPQQFRASDRPRPNDQRSNASSQSRPPPSSSHGASSAPSSSASALAGAKRRLPETRKPEPKSDEPKFVLNAQTLAALARHVKK